MSNPSRIFPLLNNGLFSFTRKNCSTKAWKYNASKPSLKLIIKKPYYGKQPVWWFHKTLRWCNKRDYFSKSKQLPPFRRIFYIKSKLIWTISLRWNRPIFSNNQIVKDLNLLCSLLKFVNREDKLTRKHDFWIINV